jgi:hypothetical protein
VRSMKSRVKSKRYASFCAMTERCPRLPVPARAAFRNACPIGALQQQVNLPEEKVNMRANCLVKICAWSQKTASRPAVCADDVRKGTSALACRVFHTAQEARGKGEPRLRLHAGGRRR